MNSGRGKYRLEPSPKELDMRLASIADRLMFMVLESTVMVAMLMLDGLSMEGGLLGGGMRSF